MKLRLLKYRMLDCRKIMIGYQQFVLNVNIVCLHFQNSSTKVALLSVSFCKAFFFVKLISANEIFLHSLRFLIQ